MSPPPPVVFKTMSFASAPAPAPPVAGEVAVRRLVAGVVDLVVVGGGLLVLTAATAGTLETKHGFAASVEGAACLLWMALVLLACFVAEVLTGRTPGKAVLGLRVARARDGGVPSTGMIAVRTLLRVIDGLPFFYALGALAILLTPTRQRVGDLAARTVVVRVRR
jgi:uncharacterized RDD family membrane protein YckC